MVITIKKLRGRPLQRHKFLLSYGAWLMLDKFGMVKVGGYLLKMEKK